jgi:type II secretory pathway pseudopilin PulG
MFKEKKRNGGFTIVELLSAMSITLILSIAVITVVLGTLNSTGRSQLNAAVQSKVQAALNSFVLNVRDSEKVYVADRNTFMFSYRTSNKCEMHKYYFIPDPTDSSSIALQHEISSVFVPGTVSCDSVEETLLTKNNTANTSRLEVDKVKIGSGFTYYSEASRAIVSPESAGFIISQQTPLCKITTVGITVLTSASTPDSENTVDNTMNVRLSNNALGLSC